MGFWGKLFGIGIAAAGAAAAVKVAQKYSENKAAEEAEAPVLPDEQPAGAQTQPTLQEVKEDLVEAAEDAAHEIKEQAADAAGTAKSKVKEAAGKAGIDTDELAGSFSEAGRAIVVAGRAVVNAGASVAHKVAEDAPEMLEKVKAGADSLLTQAKDALASVKGDEPEDGSEEAPRPDSEEKPQE